MTLAAGWALALLALVAVGASVVEQRRVGRPSWALVALAVLAVGGTWSASVRWQDALWLKGAVTVVFLACVLLHLLGRGRGAPTGPAVAPVVAAMLLWSWLTAVDLLRNDVDGLSLVGRSASGLVLVAALCLVLRGGTGLLDVRTVATWSTAVLCWSVPLSSTSWRACDAWSCGAAGQLLTGPFSSENAFGIQAALLGALAVASGGDRAARVTAGGLGALVLVLTAARTAAFALLLVVLVIGLLALLRWRAARRPARAGLVALVVVGGVSGLGVRLVATSTPSDWSNRGLVWLRAREVVGEHPLAGAGLSRWSELQAVGLLSTHFTHSLYLYLLFAGGLVGVLLFVVTAASLLRAHLAVGWRPAAPLLVLLLVGLLESVWNPLTLDATTWAAVALLVAAPRTVGAERTTAALLATPVRPVQVPA